MESLQQKVISVLESSLGGEVVDGLETVSSIGGVTGWVANDYFDGMDDQERQDKLWSLLEKHFDNDELKRLGPIVALTLKEATFDVSFDI